MLNGTGECADIAWVFLGLTIPGWTLIAFLVLAVIGLLPSLTKIEGKS